MQNFLKNDISYPPPPIQVPLPASICIHTYLYLEVRNVKFSAKIKETINSLKNPNHINKISYTNLQ